MKDIVKHQEYVKVPVEWLNELLRCSKVVRREDDKFEVHRVELQMLLGYISSAKTLIKYNKII